MNIYEKNLEALGENHPDLVELVESIKINEDKVKIQGTESADYRVLYKKDDGEEVYIHSAHDPAKCANDVIDLLGKMEKEGIVVLFGFGLGYFAEKLLARFEKGHIMIIYEATPEIFKTALMIRDISNLLVSEKVNIVIGDDDGISVIHNYHNLIINGRFWIVKHHPSVKLNEEAYKRFEKHLNDERLLAVTGIATAIGLGKEFTNAFMANIPHIMRRPGVDKVKEIFKGRPAIVVAAGPSLEKNIHLLKKAKGKALIVAVDAALPTLLPADIVPDILVAIDPEYDNIVFFKDNLLLKHVPFICLAQYAPNILDIYPGPMLINASPGNTIFKLVYGFWEDKGFIECFGGSVAHLAFAVSEYIGADTIALIGQDLSYTKNMHAGDVNKLLHDHRNPGQEFPDSTPGAIEVKNIFGEKRYTTHSFRTFKISFEKKIKTFNGTVIHATEDGVPLEGAQIMRLSDFIEERCNLPELDTFALLSEVADTDVSYNLNDLSTLIKGIKDQFMCISKNAKKILKYIHRINKLQKNGQKDSPELHNILKKVEDLTEKVKHPILSIITQYNYRLELYLKQQDIQDIDEIEDKWGRLEKQLERGQKYYNELIEEIDIFNKQLNRLIKNLKRESDVNTILMDDTIPDIKKFRKVGNIYKRAVMASQAVRYLELAIGAYEKGKEANWEEGRSQLRSLQVSLAEMYMEQFRFCEAKEILGEVRNRQKPVHNRLGTKGKYSRTKIKELLKICDEKISEWDQRKKKMGNIVKDAEANYGGFLESGQFYFRLKDYKRAEKAYLRAIRGQESEVRGQKAMDNNQQSTTDNSRSPFLDPRPPIVNAYYGLANTYLAMNKPEKSVDILGKVIEIEPDNPNPYCDLGRIAAQNNNINDAEIFFKKAIDLAPNIEESYNFLAGLYINLGEIEKATSIYENAIIVNPNNARFSQTLAGLYKKVITDFHTD